MSHLEDLIGEYLMWHGCMVKRNEKVGKLAHGGHAGELDIVAFEPAVRSIIHVEPSLDADPWTRREERYRKKFAAGREHIASLFGWLDPFPDIRQVAIFPSVGAERRSIEGASVLSVDEVVAEIRDAVCTSARRAATGAVSEQFPLLRTIQLSHVGYNRPCEPSAQYRLLPVMRSQIPNE